MKKKDVLLVVVGVALGYLASRMNWGSRTATGVKNTATGLVSDIKDVAVDSVKMAECQSKLVEKTKTMKFASPESASAYRKSFIEECMASN